MSHMDEIVALMRPVLGKIQNDIEGQASLGDLLAMTLVTSETLRTSEIRIRRLAMNLPLDTSRTVIETLTDVSGIALLLASSAALLAAECVQISASCQARSGKVLH